MDDRDIAHLERCIELADRGARTAAPNPMVGCVIVRDGAVIGEGWHERPGKPHAEVEALAAAGDATGATVYVSLEPCAHHGRTPPCVDALIEAGVRRVVVAAVDPDPRTNGTGIARLRVAGIEVEVARGPVEQRARRQNSAFRTHVLEGRPHVTYKAAASLDGRTATAAGESQWISSPESRTLVHEMRARSSAVGVGIGTALADDPMLTARELHPRVERQPLRVVFDRTARLPLTSALVQTARQYPVTVITAPGAEGADALAAAGVDILEAATPAQALADLGRRGVTSLMIEGGPNFAGGLLAAGLLDRIALFVAPVVLGEGPGVFAGFSAVSIAAAPGAVELTSRQVGPDTLLVAELREL
ncbi:MAG: diaminohydroxyphosphoribosylaminopyrimidine deaminase [Gaiellales bacterium]|nr:diaminohydroxyphosphoribosylaminopyrimidine deaminase [Gaiellales bacterium]